MPTNGAEQIKVEVTTSLVSLVGIAGVGGYDSLLSLHPQSPHSHVDASGLQQHGLGSAFFDEEQQLTSSTEPPQQDETPEFVFASTDAVESQLHADPELKNNGCKPIAAVANTISVASKVR